MTLVHDLDAILRVCRRRQSAVLRSGAPLSRSENVRGRHGTGVAGWRPNHRWTETFTHTHAAAEIIEKL